MSDSDDSEIIVKTNSRRKRPRLTSESSEIVISDSDDKPPNKDLDTNIADVESEDEITVVNIKSNNGTHSRPVLIDGEEEDDEDDEGDDDADRDNDEIIDDLYGDEDQPNARSSAAQKRVSSLRQNVVNFFENASEVDLITIPGVSKKKVEQLLTLRPIKSWEDLNMKIESHKSAGINEDVVINAVKTIKSRSVVEKLMGDCQKLAQDICQLVDRLPEAAQPKCIPKDMKLASYQLIGLNWLALMHNKGINGILADEMGLGKTIQVIAFLAYLRESLGMHRHHLIIVPSSTLDNWEREFDVWCPEIRILRYYGSQQERAQIRHFVSNNPNSVDVIITTYNVAQNPDDRRLFKKIKFQYLVFDEAHMLKNMKSSRYQSLIKIRSKRRILLTGTPLQNNLIELMSILVFAMPRMFMSKQSHVQALFSSASREEGGRTEFERERIEQAKKIMKPFVLRRLKDDVLKDLPCKSEETIECEMTKSQDAFYKNLVDSFKREITDDILEDETSFSTELNDDIKKGAGMLMAMRKAANHPLLMLNLYTKTKLREMSNLMLREPDHMEANKDFIYEDMCVMNDYELHKLCKFYKSLSKFKLNDDAIRDSGKFQKLEAILAETTKDNQKCLIFSQFTMLLDIMEEFLQINKYEYIRLDGQTKVSDRITLIDDFNQNPDIPIFLLSTKAGGLGINLTSANVVIIHDIDFNPYNDKQAMDRSHRLGQTKDVKVYKLISKDTIEEGMLEIAKEKLRLGRDMTEQDATEQVPAKDMKSLLRTTLKL